MRRLVLLFLMLALPGLALLALYQVKPPRFGWVEDPLELLVARVPHTWFPGVVELRAIGDTVSATYRDGSHVRIIVLDNARQARERALAIVEKKVSEGAVAGGALPTLTYDLESAFDRHGRVLHAEHAVVHVSAPVESLIDSRLYALPLLIDRSRESLGRTLVTERRTETIAGISVYAVLVLIGFLTAKRPE